MPHDSLITLEDRIQEMARRLATRLQTRQERIVFAESCTAGLVAGGLASVPGASEFLCGSLVVYRPECKEAWLDIPADLIQQFTTVSPQMSDCMARNAMQKTPSADWAVAITGHLGPDAPAAQDGWIYVATADRQDGQPHVRLNRARHLTADRRRPRQFEAAAYTLLLAATTVDPSSPLPEDW